MSDVFAVATRPGGPLGNSMEWYDKVTGVPVFDIGPLGSGSTLQYQKVTITAAQMLALSGTPITLLPAPGVGLFTYIDNAVFALNFNTTAFAAGSALQIIENAIVVASTTAALVNGASSVIIQAAFPSFNTTASLGAANAPVTLGVAGANFTTGNSTIDVHLWYIVITP